MRRRSSASGTWQSRTRRPSDRQRVLSVVNLCFADPSKADPEVIDAGVALAAYRRTVPGQEAAFLGAARSLMRVLANPGRYQSLMRSITKPVLLVHGRARPPGRDLRRSRGRSRQPGLGDEFLPGVGHTPQLEVPDAVVAQITRWLKGRARPGLSALGHEHGLRHLPSL